MNILFLLMEADCVTRNDLGSIIAGPTASADIAAFVKSYTEEFRPDVLQTVLHPVDLDLGSQNEGTINISIRGGSRLTNDQRTRNHGKHLAIHFYYG